MINYLKLDSILPSTSGTIRYFFFVVVVIFTQGVCNGQYRLQKQSDRWAMRGDGSLIWRIGVALPHNDHIEMSGEKVSMWIQYGVDADKRGEIKRTLVFPTFRMKPNDTHASLMYTFPDDDGPRILIGEKPLHPALINGQKREPVKQRIDSITLKGVMRVYSTFGDPAIVQLERSLFPSTEKPLAIEKFVFKNISDNSVSVAMDYFRKEIQIDSSRTTRGPHRLIMGSVGDGNYFLKPGETVELGISYLAVQKASSHSEIDLTEEEKARIARVERILDHMQLHTPEPILNSAFSFAKIRATESIFKTRGGYMHSPGGLAYYAAVWANDQAEYINPFFAMLGDPIANQSAMNAYRLFATYMNSEYKPLPSSIVAEGESYWDGAGDRGDMAMIAYGASRYALSYGSLDSAKVLWPLITWCLEYCRRKTNGEGVVESDTDELERRFPAGKANLSTSTLYYDALNSAAMLGKALGEPTPVIKNYQSRAKILKTNIEKYFGSTVEGFETYKYYKENNVLRSWICLPLSVGIYDRKEGTIDALFSSRLWTADGLATQAGEKTFWDRSTLYALRGVLQAGEVDRAMEFIRYYSQRRLLGEHVPYPVEAFPEGNQRHLAAESGLYCRIFTEGLFGIRPVGINSFSCTPRLPKEWNTMALRKVHCSGAIFDLEITREGQKGLLITVRSDKVKKFKIPEGGSVLIKL